MFPCRADFLQNLVDPFREPEVGLVNCFYRLANPATVAMRWEAIAINADFWSQVLQGRTMQPLDFALGAVMATRREALEEIGGFGALADYLADDFQLGNRIVRHAGKTIALCPVVVDCFSPPMNWREVWAHQLRWARTIRVCKPLPYALSILSNATLWPLLWVLVQPAKWSLITFGAVPAPPHRRGADPATPPRPRSRPAPVFLADARQGTPPVCPLDCRLCRQPH